MLTESEAAALAELRECITTAMIAMEDANNAADTVRDMHPFNATPLFHVGGLVREGLAHLNGALSQIRQLEVNMKGGE